METEFITNVSWAGATSHNFLFMIQLIHLLNFTRAPCIERGVTLHNIKSAQGHILIFRLNFQNKNFFEEIKAFLALASISERWGLEQLKKFLFYTPCQNCESFCIILTLYTPINLKFLSRVNWINSNCTNRNINILEMIIKRTRRMS